MVYDPNKRHFTLEEFGTELKQKFPDEFNDVGALEAAQIELDNNPYYKDYILDYYEDNLDVFDKTLGALHNTIYGFAGIIKDIGTGTLGYGAAALEAVEDSKKYLANQLGLDDLVSFTPIGKVDDLFDKYQSYKGTKLANGQDWDSSVAKFYHNQSRFLKEEGDKIFNNYVENSENLHGYLEWTQNTPYSLKNTFEYPFSMTTRAMSDLGPSIATYAAAVYYGAPVFLTGAIMEGSGEYNTAMERLRKKSEDKGEVFNPASVSKTALAASTAYGLLSGLIERFQLRSIGKAAGFTKKATKEKFIENIADKIDDNIKKTGGSVANVTNLSKKAASLGLRNVDQVLRATSEGIQEGMQQTTAEIIGNVYDKYDGDIELAAKNFAKDLYGDVSEENYKDRMQSFWSGALGGFGLGKLGRGLNKLGQGYNKRFRNDLRNKKDQEINQAISEDIGVDSAPIPAVVNPMTVDKVSNIKDFVFGPESLTEQDDINIENISNRGGQVLDPSDRFELAVEHLIEDPGIIDRGELGEVSRSDILFNIENNDFVDVLSDNQLAQIKETLGETIAPEGVERIDDPVIEKAPDTSEVIKPTEQPELDVLQAKLDDVNKKLQTNVTGKLKAKLEKDKIELEKSLGVTPEKTVDTSVDPAILAERKKRQDKFIEESKNKSLEELRGVAKARNIPNFNNLNKQQILTAISNQEPSRLPEEILDDSKSKQKLKDIINKGKKKVVPLVKKGDSKYRAAEEVIGDDVSKIIEEPIEKIKNQQIDYQKPQKGKKVIDNKQTAKELAARLKKKFPYIKQKELEKVLDEEGNEVAGRAFKAVVEWSKGKATLDTIPHEYGHLFIRIMKDSPIIKEGIKRFGSEEKLVQYMGEYYANKIQDKKLLSRFKTWLRKFRNELKNFFGMALTDKQLGNLISERFFSYDMKEKDLFQLLEFDTIDFQKIIRTSKFRKVLNKAFDSSFEIALLKIKDGMLDINTYIDIMESNLPERYRENFRDWLSSRKESNILGFNSIKERVAKSLETNPLNHNPIQYNTSVATIETLQNFLDNEIALHEGEHDSRSNGNEYAIGVLNLFNVDIYRNEAFKLFEAARSKSYADWKVSNFIPLLNSKGKLQKDLTKDEERRARRLYYVTTNQVESNRGIAHKLINPITLIRRGSKESPIFDYKYIAESQRVYTKQYKKGFIQEQAKFLTNWISHNIPHIAGMSRGMSVLNGRSGSSMFFVPDADGNLIQSYEFLNVDDLVKLQKSAVMRNKTIIFTRGDNKKLYLADISPIHKNHAKDDKSYKTFWDNALEKGYITKDQNKTFLSIKDKVQREKEIASFEYTNALFPGYMKDSFENVLKRIKIPLTPSYVSDEMPDLNTFYINTDKINFRYKGKSVEGIKKIADVGDTYIGDGNTLTSRNTIQTIANIFGLNPNTGHLKTIIYDVSRNKDNKGNLKNIKDVDLLMIKHQQSIPEAGLEIYDGDTLIGRVDNSNNIIAADGKTIIDMILTNDEAKKAEGKYNTNNFIVKGSSLGLIKMVNKKKKKVKFPLQWLNHLFNTDLINIIKEEYAGTNSKSYKIMSNTINSTADSSSLKSLVNTLKRSFPDQLSSALYDFVDSGLGFHPAASYGLETLIRSKLFNPAFNMDNQDGVMLQMTPNYVEDLNTDEIAIGISDATQIIKQYKKETNKKSPTIEELNSWLANNDIRVLAYRSPIPYIGGADYVRIKRVHNIDGTVQVNTETTFRQYEGDHDGDHLVLHFVSEKLDPVFKQYFKSEEYLNLKRGLDLSEFVVSKNINSAVQDDRFSMIEAMIKGESAIGEVAKVQGIYGLIKQTFNYLDVDGVRIGLNTGNVDLSFMKPGYKDTVDHMLRIYIQASVDNAKFLLLDKWNYSQRSLIQKLFVVQNGVYKGKTLEDVMNDRLGYGKKLYDKLYKNLWTRYKKVYDVRNMGDYTIGGYDIDRILYESNNVLSYSENRKSSYVTESSFKNVQTILESIISMPSAIYNNKILNNPTNHKESIMRYSNETLLASHIEAVETLLPRLEEIKEKYKAFPKEFELIQGRINTFINMLNTNNLEFRKIMPLMWEQNETFLKVRDNVARYVESFKTEDKWEAFTIMYLDTLLRSDVKATKFKKPAQINIARLEKLLPLELLHKKTISKYIKNYNNHLFRDVTQTDKNMMNNEKLVDKGCQL